MANIALIVAAGEGARFDATVPKQYLTVEGIPILRRAILAFLEHPNIDNVQVVINHKHIDYYQQATFGLDLLPYCFGGGSRQISVARGLANIEKLGPERVLIHDAARPFISKQLISRVLEALEGDKAVLPILKIVDTVKRVLDGGQLLTVDRENLVKAQTPQGFHYETIWGLYQRVGSDVYTDDIGLCETFGVKVSIVAGEATNIKLTYLEDIGGFDE